MKNQLRKLEIAVFVMALVIIVLVWAVNGYDDTWLYVTAIAIAIPTSWVYFRNKDK